MNSPTLGAQKPFVFPVVAALVPESPLRSSFCPRGLGEDSPEAACSRTRKEKPRHRGPCGHVLVARPRAASPQGAHLRGRFLLHFLIPNFSKICQNEGSEGRVVDQLLATNSKFSLLVTRTQIQISGQGAPSRCRSGWVWLARWQPTPQPGGGALLLPVTQKSPSHPAWRARGARDAFASRDGGGEVLIPSGIPQGSSPAESLVPIF